MRKITLLSVATLGVLCFAAFGLMGSQSAMRQYKLFTGGMSRSPWVTGYCYRILNPAAADTGGILTKLPIPVVAADSTVAFSTGEKAAFAVESAKAPRGLAIKIADCVGNDNSVDATAITVTGTNILGQTITSTFTPTNNTAGAVTETAKTAFKTIASVTMLKESSTTPLDLFISIGFNTDFGLPFTSPENTIAFANVSGTVAHETTVAVATVSGTDIELNTVTFNTAPNGTLDYSVYLFWPCYQSATANTQW